MKLKKSSAAVLCILLLCTVSVSAFAEDFVIGSREEQSSAAAAKNLLSAAETVSTSDSSGTQLSSFDNTAPEAAKDTSAVSRGVSSYTYTITTDKTDNTVMVGDEITVRLMISGEADKNGKIVLRASFQDKIEFDTRYFTYIANSITTYSSEFSASPNGTKEWVTVYRANDEVKIPDGSTILSFRLRAVRAGELVLAHTGPVMSTAAGEKQEITTVNAAVKIVPHDPPVTMSYDESTITLTNYDPDPITVCLWAVTYDGSGKMLSAAPLQGNETVTVAGSFGTETVSYTPGSDAACTKLFFLDDNFCPLSGSLSWTAE